MSLTVLEQPYSSSIRQIQAMEKWAIGHLGTIEHERRVAQIAAKLFDLTRPQHGLDSAHRQLLRLAAIVHDVGRCADSDTHPRRGARMILAADGLPLTPPQRRALAYLTRYHRGRVPKPARDAILRPTDDHKALQLTLALLRAADGLDSRSLQSPALLFASQGRRLAITCYLDRDCSKARNVYTRRKKFRLLETALDCKVEVQVSIARTIRMVA